MNRRPQEVLNTEFRVNGFSSDLIKNPNRAPPIILRGFPIEVAIELARVIDSIPSGNVVRTALARQARNGVPIVLQGVIGVEGLYAAALGLEFDRSISLSDFHGTVAFTHGSTVAGNISESLNIDRGDGQDIRIATVDKTLGQFVRLEYWEEVLPDGNGDPNWKRAGYSSAESAIAMTIIHEILHVLVLEPGAERAGGHLELYARFADPSEDPLTLNTLDLPNDDITYLSYLIGRESGAFSDDGSKFLQASLDFYKSDDVKIFRDLRQKFGTSLGLGVSEGFGHRLDRYFSASSSAGPQKLVSRDDTVLVRTIRDPSDSSIILGGDGNQFGNCHQRPRRRGEGSKSRRQHSIHI